MAERQDRTYLGLRRAEKSFSFAFYVWRPGQFRLAAACHSVVFATKTLQGFISATNRASSSFCKEPAIEPTNQRTKH